jgi:hypothetical protein
MDIGGNLAVVAAAHLSDKIFKTGYGDLYNLKDEREEDIDKENAERDEGGKEIVQKAEGVGEEHEVMETEIAEAGEEIKNKGDELKVDAEAKEVATNDSGDKIKNKREDLKFDAKKAKVATEETAKDMVDTEKTDEAGFDKKTAEAAKNKLYEKHQGLNSEELVNPEAVKELKAEIEANPEYASMTEAEKQAIFDQKIEDMFNLASQANQAENEGGMEGLKEFVKSLDEKEGKLLAELLDLENAEDFLNPEVLEVVLSTEGLEGVLVESIASARDTTEGIVEGGDSIVEDAENFGGEAVDTGVEIAGRAASAVEKASVSGVDAKEGGLKIVEGGLDTKTKAKTIEVAAEEGAKAIVNRASDMEIKSDTNRFETIDNSKNFAKADKTEEAEAPVNKGLETRDNKLREQHYREKFRPETFGESMGELLGLAFVFL